MSEVQARPAATRGRGSAVRGGRGGFSSRGGRNPSRSANTNGDAKHEPEVTALPTLDDPEVAHLKDAYGTKLPIVKELFPDWSDVDILYGLQETDGDEALTVERIADGTISQWGEVSKQKKDRTKPKAKDTFTTTTGADAPSTRPARGGGRAEGGRGRGRATERGARGAARGRSAQPATNGSRVKENQALSVPTDESNAWDTTKNNDDGGWAQAAAATSWETPAADPAPTAPTAPAKPAEPLKSAVIPQGTQKTWASMIRQTIAPKPAPQPSKEPSAPKPEPPLEPLPAAAESSAPAPEPEPEPEPIAELSAEPQHEQAPADNATVVVPEVALPPSKDELTETNLDQIVDESHHHETDTVASEAADSWDPRAPAGSATATPISASQAHHQAHKATSSGYAATAAKATERAPVPRTPSHQQRRFLDQREAVRMPVAAQQLERAAVQFGAFNLNGSEDDIDGDREEPETRAQPPADSPVTQPRASLPPAPPAAGPDAFSAQKPVSSLPPGAVPTGNTIPFSPEGAEAPFGHRLPHGTNADLAAQAPPAAPAAQQHAAQAVATQPPTHPAAQQFGRFGQPAAQEQSSFPPKPFDSYNQGSQPSAAAQSHFDGFPSQQQSQSQPQSQQPGGAYSSAADQYSSYYTADQQSRPPYNNYYGQYGQGQQQHQAGQGQQEGGLASRAGFSGYGASQGDLTSQYPQSANQSRFGATVAQDQTSGNSTPNPPATQGQQPASQNHPQAHGGQQQHGSQFFGQQQQPYYGSYYNNHMNQYGYGSGGFGPYGGKGGVYGQAQPHHYAMSQQSPYDYGSSSATGYPQSSLHRPDSGTGSGLGDYGRAGSAQSGAQAGFGGGAGLGGMHEAFGRGASAYGAQASQSFNGPTTQPGGAGNDDLKPFGDGKAASGPSPSLANAARPGSATNTAPSQTGLPPPQSAQQGMGYGGYPSHLQGHGLHGAASGTTGYGMGAASAQGHQNTPYGSAAYGGFGSYYGGQQGQQQGQQQQQHRGGWGNQYGAGFGGS